MTKTETVQAIALAVMVATFPLFVWGTNDESPVIVIVAAALLAVGALTLTVLRFIPLEDD